MQFTRRTFLVAAPLALAACATNPPSPVTPSLPVTLADAFTGRATGRGVFLLTLDGSERRFTATLNGRLTGNTLTVAETFLYDDGQTDALTWVFTRTAAGWTGKREDTVGVATVQELGREVRLAYTADFKSPRGVTRLGFSDVIYRRPDGLIVNDGIVTRLGIPIGKVRFEIRPR